MFGVSSQDFIYAVGAVELAAGVMVLLLPNPPRYHGQAVVTTCSAPVLSHQSAKLAPVGAMHGLHLCQTCAIVVPWT